MGATESPRGRGEGEGEGSSQDPRASGPVPLSQTLGSVMGLDLEAGPRGWNPLGPFQNCQPTQRRRGEGSPHPPRAPGTACTQGASGSRLGLRGLPGSVSK